MGALLQWGCDVGNACTFVVSSLLMESDAGGPDSSDNPDGPGDFLWPLFRCT